MAATILTVSNHKGGVGKTTTAATVGHGLAIKGKRVLLVDLDPQGQLAPALGLRQEPGIFDLLVSGRGITEVVRYARDHLYLVPGNTRTATAQTVATYESADPGQLGGSLAEDLCQGVDFVIIDTAPSVGFFQTMALTMADLVLIPCACDHLALRGIASLVDSLAELKAGGWAGRLMGILPTFYDNQTRESARNLAELQTAFGQRERGGLVLEPIHRATVIREATAEGQTVFEYAAKCRAVEEYKTLVWSVSDAATRR